MSSEQPRESLAGFWVGRAVTVQTQRPELARFAGKRGRVIAVNCNGRALVQFEGTNIGWYDIAPEYLELDDDAHTAS